MKDRNLAAAISFFAGSTSLAMETIWIRLISFASNNSPQTISIVLAIFLLGVASGAYIGKRYCTETPDPNLLWKKAIAALIFSGIIDLLAPVVLVKMNNIIFVPLVMLLFVYLTALSKSILFPIVHHIGTQNNESSIGHSISRIYFFNIIGSTISPLIIGFWLLDHIGSVQVIQIIGSSSVILGASLGSLKGARWAPTAIGAIAVLLVPDTNLIKKLAVGSDITKITFFIENRHGVIHTTYNPQKGDGVFGGNLYDGRINIDPFLDTNGITRAYLLEALSKNTKRILEIGLSGGAWARVISAFPGLERMDIVEINPGYIELIKRYKTVRPILSDKKIHIHIDDGRRWLQRYNGPPFDIIVINNTYHWRAFATNMLSKEFMQLISKNLAPNGIYAFNTTGSIDAFITASAVFPHTYQWKNTNFVYASFKDFRNPNPQAVARKIKISLNHLGVNSTPTEADNLLYKLAHPPWLSIDQLKDTLKRQATIISDWNLVPEYKHGRFKAWPF